MKKGSYFCRERPDRPPRDSFIRNLRTGSRPQEDAAVAAPLKNVSRSALIWSALVVGMPWGKPLLGFQDGALHQLGGEGGGVGVRDDLVVVAVHDQRRHGELLEILGEVGL